MTRNFLQSLCYVYISWIYVTMWRITTSDQHRKSDKLSIYIKRYYSELLINAKQKSSGFDLVFDCFFLINVNMKQMSIFKVFFPSFYLVNSERYRYER